MLTTIREKTQGIIATIILLLIVIPFALWGINSYFDGGSKVNVAEVNGTEISQQDYRRALEPMRGQVPPKTLDSREFKQQMLDGLIERTLLLQDAERQGLRVSNARLAQLIRAEPYFQQNGRFDPQIYEQLLRREGIEVREFEARLRGQNLTGQIQSGFVSSAIVTDAEVDALVRLLRQEREIDHAVIRPESAGTRVAVSAEEIEAYYNAHGELGVSPEQLRVAYVRLVADDLISRYQPTAEELEKAYAEEASRYVKPAKRRVAHVLVEVPSSATPEQAQAAEAKIHDLEKKIRAGLDFAAAAKQFSDDKDSGAKGGDLGELRPGAMPKEIDAVVATLRAGQVSAPVRTTYGYHLVKLTAYTPESRKPLNDVKPELTKLVRARRGEEKYFEMAEKFRDLVYAQPESLEPAAKALGLEIKISDWFTRSGGPGVAADHRVVEAAFQPEVLSKSRNSDAVEVGNAALVAVRVVDHRPATRKSLAELKPQIQRLLKEDKARSAAREQGEAWLKELQAGQATLATLASKAAFKLEPRKTVTRDTTKGIDQRIVQAAFRAGRPEAGKAGFVGADLGSGGYALVALVRVNDPDPAKADAATRDKARRLLSERRGAGYYAAYRAGLKQQAKIKVYPDQL
jgi:peptidyl-prolyl cis-trans isomerase D